MSIYLVLDLLLILLIALFAPIGFWRGPVKELLVTLGVLFGILLADFWARPWGSDLADITAIGASGGAFVVAMTFMVMTTFVLGYGAGAAIAPTDFSPTARVIGAFIALFNGTLLVAFSLQYVRVYLLSPSTEESLYDSYVVQFLLDQIGWVLLVVALVAWPALLGILITGRRAYEHVDDFAGYGYGPADDIEYDDFYYADVDEQETQVRPATVPETRTFPPRVPASRSDEQSHVYKAEPVAGPSRPTDATRPIRVNEEWRSPESSRPANTQQNVISDDTDPDMTIISSGIAREGQGNDDGDTPASREYGDLETELAPGYSRCVNCHAVLPPDTRVCPVCGEVN